MPSGDMPPPGTMMCMCGWWVSARPQVLYRASGFAAAREMALWVIRDLKKNNVTGRKGWTVEVTEGAARCGRSL